MSRQAFSRSIDLPGWSQASRWGYDDVLEAYWVLLEASDDAPPVRVGAEHLLVTLDALARALESSAGVPAGAAYLALTA